MKPAPTLSWITPEESSTSRGIPSEEEREETASKHFPGSTNISAVISSSTTWQTDLILKVTNLSLRVMLNSGVFVVFSTLPELYCGYLFGCHDIWNKGNEMKSVKRRQIIKVAASISLRRERYIITITKNPNEDKMTVIGFIFWILETKHSCAQHKSRISSIIFNLSNFHFVYCSKLINVEKWEGKNIYTEKH